MFGYFLICKKSIFGIYHPKQIFADLYFFLHLFILLRRELSPFGMKVSIVEPGAFKTSIIQSTLDSFQTSWNKTPSETKEYYGQLYVDNCELKFEQLGCRLHIYLIGVGVSQMQNLQLMESWKIWKIFIP